MNTNRCQTLGLLAMSLSVTFFTAHTLILKWLMSLRDLAPALPLFFRAVVGALIVFLIFSRNRKCRPLKVAPILTDKRLVSRGLTGLIGTAAFYYTIPALGAGKASLLLSSYVLLAAIIAAIFLKEVLQITQAVWLMIAFIGIAFLLSSQTGTLTPSLGFHELLGLFGALMAAMVVVLIRQLSKDFSAGTIFLAQCVWIGTPILPFAILHLAGLTVTDYLALISVGITAAGGQLSMNEGYRRLPVTVGSSMQNIVPLFITVGGVTLFDEKLTTLQVTGGAMILVGAFFVSFYRSRHRTS